MYSVALRWQRDAFRIIFSMHHVVIIAITCQINLHQMSKQLVLVFGNLYYLSVICIFYLPYIIGAKESGYIYVYHKHLLKFCSQCVLNFRFITFVISLQNLFWKIHQTILHFLWTAALFCLYIPSIASSTYERTFSFFKGTYFQFLSNAVFWSFIHRWLYKRC